MIARRKNLTVTGIVVIAAASIFLVGEALACFSPGPTFRPDPDAPKIVIGKPRLEVQKIERGGSKPGRTGTCDTYGKIFINVSPAIDNVGYEFEIVEDEEAKSPPEGFEVPDRPQLPPAGQDMFILHWEDGLEGPQEKFKFKLRVKTYAPDGTEGPESDPILIEHPGG